MQRAEHTVYYVRCSLAGWSEITYPPVGRVDCDRFMQAEQWLDRTVSDRERCPWGPQQQIRPLCRHGVESMGHPTQHPRRINKKHGRPIQPRCSGANVCHGSTVLPFFFFHPYYIQYVCLSVTVIPSHTEDEQKSNAGVVEYCMIGTIPCPHI
jgi:hypothetical protein